MTRSELNEMITKRARYVSENGIKFVEAKKPRKGGFYVLIPYEMCYFDKNDYITNYMLCYFIQSSETDYKYTGVIECRYFPKYGPYPAIDLQLFDLSLPKDTVVKPDDSIVNIPNYYVKPKDRLSLIQSCIDNGPSFISENDRHIFVPMFKPRLGVFVALIVVDLLDYDNKKSPIKAVAYFYRVGNVLKYSSHYSTFSINPKEKLLLDYILQENLTLKERVLYR